MDLSGYFIPVEISDGLEGTLSKSITQLSKSTDPREFDLAIAWIEENRWNEVELTGETRFFERCMKDLATLYAHDCNPSILNLGVFKSGNSVSDTEAGLSEVIEFLLQCKVLPVIIGAARNITYAAYKAFQSSETIANITSIDNYLNIDESGDQGYIGRIIKEQPNFLFNYSNVGYQTYFVAPAELELADSLYFDAYRLGMVRGNIPHVEPVIRSAEIISCSLEVIKGSDFGGANAAQPNGFYAEEFCQIMRYAGLAEKAKVVLLTDLNVRADSDRDAILMAEILWCFIDGFYGRKPEIPGSNRNEFLKYRVPIRNDDFQLVFYKSMATDRWWMEVPVPPQYANKYRKHHMVPCGYEDYLIATKDDLPERWWKAYKKML